MKSGVSAGWAAVIRSISAVSSVVEYVPSTSAAVAQAGVSPALPQSVEEFL